MSRFMLLGHLDHDKHGHTAHDHGDDAALISSRHCRHNSALLTFRFFLRPLGFDSGRLMIPFSEMGLLEPPEENK